MAIALTVLALAVLVGVLLVIRSQVARSDRQARRLLDGEKKRLGGVDSLLTPYARDLYALEKAHNESLMPTV